jgi:23S rRNA U2552 (ribose-2'-O)-methylase RlmE/FtsJ
VTGLLYMNGVGRCNEKMFAYRHIKILWK